MRTILLAAIYYIKKDERFQIPYLFLLAMLLHVKNETEVL